MAGRVQICNMTRSAMPRSVSRLASSIVRLSASPRHWVCVRSRPTATGVWAGCMLRPASENKRASSSPLLSKLYQAMEMTF
jgi:hypothetical protein